MMSQDLMKDLNTHILSGIGNYQRSSSGSIWGKPSEYLTIEDPDIPAFFQSVGKVKEQTHKATLDPSEYSDCMSKFDGLKQKVKAVLEGRGATILKETRQNGDSSLTWAENWAQVSYLQYALTQIYSDPSGKPETLSDKDVFSLLPGPAMDEWSRLSRDTQSGQ
ncbi:hypothetical protein I302_106076 [Kwoniella bestiolae CBS 10118]|uniref:Uncharacterized protein n=1 Tax=Kwoniella bestiolae CBS 10118 TaxID=1296100 RepID=A0A1B9G2Y2_9TREE|nr:hypothetical protein I302_05202 [Kwoniella bestiolae CBS 10118]OCF25383.1 hypothetical protein I302_05202 [Kwoniella bestiolae CBS 10118]